MFNLANCYRNGEGTEKNLEKAFDWCQKAAEKDHIDAMFNLANRYYNGEGTEKNLKKAFHWCLKAAEKDYIDAINGEGTEKNLEKAFHWCQKAAEKDYINAIYGLGILYTNGEGTEKNLEKAFHWCQKAAEKGHIDAVFNLAACYRNGEGTEKNLEKAFYWHQIVAESYKTNSKDEVEFCNEYLMKKCWDSNPSNRPTIIILENIISEWIRCINIYYEINKDGNYIYSVPITDNQLKNDMFEFIEADKALLQEQVNVFIMQSHPQAYYISRKLTEILVQEESQGFDCMIKDY
ncbi:unnamed protein product [Rhizophagus irregularis]|nr:unnamed protein product [Rhizophagus irregularis]